MRPRSSDGQSRIGFNSRGVLGLRGTAFVSGTALGNNGIWCSREFHRKTDDDEFEVVEMLQEDLDDRSYRRQTDHFIEAITTGRKPLVSVADGYQALRVSHAILESARTGETVRLVWRDNQGEKRATIRMRNDVATRPRVT